MRKKGLIALGLAAVMTASALTGCGGASDKKESSSKKEAKGTVYYLNFKPEADAQWQELADIYTEKTGVKVNVVTAAANQYETTLKSEMGKSEAPTLFQVNGPVGLASWKDYCYDLKDSEIAKQITSDDFLLKDGDSVTIIKDLKVKGASSALKAGTKVKNIRLVDGDHNIDCKIDGFGAMSLKSEFVKKL